MKAMTTATSAQLDTSLRDEWLRTIQNLQSRIKTWVYMEPGWSTTWGEEHKIEEEPLGVYSVTDLNIHTPKGMLVVEPVARNYPSRGIVELYAWPTLFRVRLLRDEADDIWQVRVDSGFTLHQDWNRENFVRLGKDLLGAS